jgi:hypothetical protein
MNNCPFFSSLPFVSFWGRGQATFISRALIDLSKDPFVDISSSIS